MNDAATLPKTFNWRKLGWGTIAVVFAIPVIAKLTVEGMLWDSHDFAVWAGMLLVAGALGEVVLRVFGSGPAVMGGLLGIATGFLLTWVNLAVGFIGNENNSINQAYFVMLAIAFAASLVVRFRPGALVLVLISCAVGQIAIVLAAMPERPFEWVATGVFCLLWLSAAALFRKAAKA